jgi:uncharacterized repeat protein (TIGR03803 family)
MKPFSRSKAPSRLSDSLNHRVSTYTLGVWGAMMFILLVFGAMAQAQTFGTLDNNFSANPFPESGVIRDSAGNLYGTTYAGGDQSCADGCGVVYKLDTAGRESVLHAFSGSPSDGALPVAPVVRDKAGNIYGTTPNGGSGSVCQYGCGTVFKIDTAGDETVLYSFTGGSDGCLPAQGLGIGKSGALFGTTLQCGFSNYGTIFKLDSAGSFSVLHHFAGFPSDGGGPLYGHLTMDKSGNLYGVTTYGGSGRCKYGCGVLYKLSPSGTLALLYSFKGAPDGCQPEGSVLPDDAGNFYGTTSYCGADFSGTVWKVSKKGNETILHQFLGGYSGDGCNPTAGVSRDTRGNLYGVAVACGSNMFGTVYELSAKGKYTSYSLGNGNSNPYGEVLVTPKGKILGTSAGGGDYDDGTVWYYIP